MWAEAVEPDDDHEAAVEMTAEQDAQLEPDTNTAESEVTEAERLGQQEDALSDAQYDDNLDADYQTPLYVDASSDESYGYAEEQSNSEPDEYEQEQVAVPEVVLPGADINFDLDMHQANFHFIQGRADSDIGKILFKSRLMPSNEVKLSLKMKQRESDDIELTAYFDLANFTMELDGANAVLNKDHKALLEVLDTHLRYTFEQKYHDVEPPEHAFMLVQMLSYWSVSPEGYVHEKRSIVSNQ